MAKKEFIVDGGVKTYGNSLLDGDVVVGGNIILADGSQLISENTSSKIDFAQTIDMNGHRLMNHADYVHPYDLATKQLLEDSISNSITNVTQIQLDKLTSLNTLLNDPAKLLEAQNSVDEKIDVTALNTLITNAEAIIQTNIDDATALAYAQLNANKANLEANILAKETAYDTMVTTYQSKLSELSGLTTAFQNSFNSIVTQAKAYADLKINQVINAAPTDLDTLGELAVRFQTVSNNIDTNLSAQIASKVSTSYVDSTLAQKANDSQVLKWVDPATQELIEYPEAILTLDKVTANAFVGDGSKLTGLAAAGVFSAAWDRIVDLQNRLTRVQAIIGLAQSYTQLLLIRTIDNPAQAGASSFGNSVAVAGTKVVVGAYNHEDTGAAFSGRAYIADRLTGVLVPIFNPVPSANVKFGNSVDINKAGTIAIIGAQGFDGSYTDDGRAYLVDTTTGSILQSVSNPNAHVGDAFGYSVSIDTDYALVGSKYYDTTTTDAGSAFALVGHTDTNNLGTVVREYPNPDEAQQRYHGAAVSVDGVYAVVGAPGLVDGATVYPGMISMYNMSESATTPEWTVTNPNLVGTSQLDDNFGSAVDITRKYVVVGAYTDSSAGGLADSGTVYVYKRDTAELLYTFANPNDADTAANDRFGYSVAVSGEILVVGAPGEKAFGTTTQTGIVYVYNLTTGELLFTLRNPNTDEVAQFGFSVDIEINTVVVGAPDTNGSQGRIYIYNLS